MGLDYDFHITTPRLYITYLNPDNPSHLNMLVERFSAMNCNYGEDDARKYMESQSERLERTGWGRYAIIARPEAEIGAPEPTTPFAERIRGLMPVGVTSMQHMRFPDIPAPDIPDVGFGLSPWATGKGYATEAAAALMGHFETKGFKAFGGFTDEDNHAARKVLRKLGMQEVGVADVQGVTPNGVDRVMVYLKGVGTSKDELEKIGLTMLKDIETGAVEESPIQTV